MSSTASMIAAIQAMVAGLTKHYGGQTLVVNNTAITVDELVVELDAFVTQVATTKTAQVAWKQELAAQQASKTRVAPLLLVLRHYVQVALGATNPTLGDFGLAPAHPRVRTTVEKLTAVQRSLATRAARGTKGKRQRARIHGVVPAVATAAKPSEPSKP